MRAAVEETDPPSEVAVTTTPPEAKRELPKIVSVDDHVIEPPNVWLDRLPKKYHDVAPRTERHGVGGFAFNGTKYSYELDESGPVGDWWFYEDLQVPLRRIIAAVGFKREEMT